MLKIRQSCSNPFHYNQARVIQLKVTKVRQPKVLEAQTQETKEVQIPSFIPFPQVTEILEDRAKTLLKQYKQVELQIPSLEQKIKAGYVQLDEFQCSRSQQDYTFCLLHGFDSSVLEYRRLLPLLTNIAPSYGVDLVGWGFSDYTPFQQDPNLRLGPQQKREHLYSFWKEVLKEKKIILIGCSLGGAIAVDFAYHHPEAVKGLVLIDPQLFTEGTPLGKSLPNFVYRLGVSILKQDWLRQFANKLAYYNKNKFATDDARRIGKLHTYKQGWTEASIAFIKSSGYAIGNLVPQILVPTKILWGRNDEIIDPVNAKLCLQKFQNCQLEYIDECGHCPHLEQPEIVTRYIQEFSEQFQNK